jgi:AAHS family 3-hydroxyphenylpropionic acid transporter
VEIFGGGRLARTLLLWVSMFLGVVTLYLLLNWLPTLLVNNGMSKTQAAAVQVGFNVGGALAALQIGTLLEGRFRNASILITFITLPLLLAGLSRLPPEITVTLVVVFLLGCAILASLAFLNATAPECYPTIIRGIGVGAVVAAGRLGSVAGPKLGGVLQSMGHNTSQLLMDIVPLAVVASLTGLLLAWIVAQHRRST